MFKRLLIAVDDSPSSLETIPLAAELANEDTLVEVVHIREFPYPYAVAVAPALETKEAAASVVSKVVAGLRELDVHASGVLVGAPHGRAARAILQRAKATGADVIVVGTRGPSLLGRLLRGSVAHTIVQRADCPVMVAREHGRSRARTDLRTSKLAAA